MRLNLRTTINSVSAQTRICKDGLSGSPHIFSSPHTSLPMMGNTRNDWHLPNRTLSQPGHLIPARPTILTWTLRSPPSGLARPPLGTVPGKHVTHGMHDRETWSRQNESGDRRWDQDKAVSVNSRNTGRSFTWKPQAWGESTSAARAKRPTRQV